MIIDFRNRSMKSEPPGSGRQPSGPMPGACDMSKSLRNGTDRGNPLLRQVSLAAAAAFHDHISCAKSAAELLEPMPCDTDHLYAHCGDDAPDDSEQDRLRAIVVLHTDLIQHQEEVIAERERQIDELRIQRDELQERLRRLQACVAHVACQTEDMFVDARPPLLVTELLRPEPHSTALASSSELFEEVAPCESPEVPAVPEEEPAVQEHRGRSPLSKTTAEPPGRPPAAEPTRGEDAIQKQQQAEPAPPPPPRGPPPAAEDEERAQEAPAEVPAAPVQSSSQEAAAPPEPSARKAGRKRSAAARDDPGRLLYNHQAYASCAARPPPAEEASAEAIEVPTWRVNHISSLYSMEGTENLDDEVFRKRHAKLEANEKRRKRWDLQLLREQQHTERLRRRMERSVEKPPSCPPTFSGELRHVHFVEVVEDLPVLAFGQPIPELQPAEFTLPWVKHPLRHSESTGDRMASKKQRKTVQSKGPWR